MKIKSSCRADRRERKGGTKGDVKIMEVKRGKGVARECKSGIRRDKTARCGEQSASFPPVSSPVWKVKFFF